MSLMELEATLEDEPELPNSLGADLKAEPGDINLAKMNANSCWEAEGLGDRCCSSRGKWDRKTARSHSYSRLPDRRPYRTLGGRDRSALLV
jgi:hypothetical protein